MIHREKMERDILKRKKKKGCEGFISNGIVELRNVGYPEL